MSHSTRKAMSAMACSIIALLMLLSAVVSPPAAYAADSEPVPAPKVDFENGEFTFTASEFKNLLSEALPVGLEAAEAENSDPYAVEIRSVDDNAVYSNILFAKDDETLPASSSEEYGIDGIGATLDGAAADIQAAIITVCDPSLSQEEAVKICEDLIDSAMSAIPGATDSGASINVATGHVEKNGLRYDLVYSDSPLISSSFIVSVAPVSDTDTDTGSEAAPVTYTDSRIIARVQEELNKLGYNCGTPDGVIGTQSTAAVNQYQEDNGITVTADITDELLDSLGIELIDGNLAPTTGEKNALRSANTYLNVLAFSYDGLIRQLEFEGYSHVEAVYGADNCGADWDEQAVKKAASYLSIMSFSKQGLIDQLEFEGFTHDQAVYGAKQNGY